MTIKSKPMTTRNLTKTISTAEIRATARLLGEVEALGIIEQAEAHLSTVLGPRKNWDGVALRIHPSTPLPGAYKYSAESTALNLTFIKGKVRIIDAERLDANQRQADYFIGYDASHGALMLAHHGVPAV